MNILEILDRFPTQESCIAFLEATRWGSGSAICPYCESCNTAKGQRHRRCYDCKRGFSVLVGTAFHGTHLPLRKWFMAIALMLNAKKGLSALQLSRDLEINKNTAWRIMMQIRGRMRQSKRRDLLIRIDEMDKVRIGGKPLRTYIQERDDRRRTTLTTDETTELTRAVARHADWYVDDDINANRFWELLIRGVSGQYHILSYHHLQQYVDEFCYRYDLRAVDPFEAFHFTVRRCLGVVEDRSERHV